MRKWKASDRAQGSGQDAAKSGRGGRAGLKRHNKRRARRARAPRRMVNGQSKKGRVSVTKGRAGQKGSTQGPGAGERRPGVTRAPKNEHHSRSRKKRPRKEEKQKALVNERKKSCVEGVRGKSPTAAEGNSQWAGAGTKDKHKPKPGGRKAGRGVTARSGTRKEGHANMPRQRVREPTRSEPRPRGEQKSAAECGRGQYRSSAKAPGEHENRGSGGEGAGEG